MRDVLQLQRKILRRQQQQHQLLRRQQQKQRRQPPRHIVATAAHDPGSDQAQARLASLLEVGRYSVWRNALSSRRGIYTGDGSCVRR